jgi:transcriptional regulator with XRE-family HTH domain
MSAAALPRNSQADQSFGRRLRRERERRKIALSSIAENTKISVSLFEDLERDDPSRWPSGIFRKSFIRAYAKAVGLDPDETAREFHERFPDPNDPDYAPLAPPGTVPHPPAAARSGTTSPAIASVPSPSLVSAPYSPSTPPADAGRRPLTFAERATSIAWDAGMIITFGLLLDAVFGSLWMPLTLVMAIYYAGGILLFGSTPGAALQTPAVPSLRLRRFVRSSSDESSSSTDSDPSHRSDERTVRPYQAREI